MFEIKVTVDIPGLPEAITALATAMAGAPRVDGGDAKKGSRTRGPKKEAPAEEPKNEPVPEPTAPETPVAPPAPAPVADPTPMTAAPTPAPVAPPAAPVAAPPTKTLTMNDIATAGAQLIDKGKMGQLLELLKKYSVQAVTQLKESDYPAFAADLRTLGAEI